MERQSTLLNPWPIPVESTGGPLWFTGGQTHQFKNSKWDRGRSEQCWQPWLSNPGHYGDAVSFRMRPQPLNFIIGITTLL